MICYLSKVRTLKLSLKILSLVSFYLKCTKNSHSFDYFNVQTETFIDDFLVDISKSTVNDQNVYSIPFVLGSVPGMRITLVLATNAEWTYVAGKNCKQELGCSHGTYDVSQTTSEKVNTTLIYSTVSTDHKLFEKIFCVNRPCYKGYGYQN